MSLLTHMIALAGQEFARFEGGKRKEHEHGFYQRIGIYWQSIGLQLDGRSKDSAGVRIPWSAAFVSWIVKTATKATGAKVAFPNADAHSDYMLWATSARKKNDPAAPFFAYNFDEVTPQLGDILVNNRLGGQVAYAHQPNGYSAHGAIVTEVDLANRFIVTIGGNEADSVGQRKFKLDANGRVVQLNTNGKPVKPGEKPIFFIGIVRFTGVGEVDDTPDVDSGTSLDKARATTAEGFDCSVRLPAPTFACLAANGKRFALKYLFPGSVLKHKDWTAAELTAAKAAGLLRGLIMQEKGSAAADFSKAKGIAAATKALAQAKALGAPKAATVYFSVDFDASPAEIASNIAPHFEGIFEEFSKAGDPFRIGVYGSSLVAIKLQTKNLVQNTWINGSTGHGFGTRAEYLKSNRWTLLQHNLDHTECGAEIDDNTCRDLNGAGFF